MDAEEVVVEAVLTVRDRVPGNVKKNTIPNKRSCIEKYRTFIFSSPCLMIFHRTNPRNPQY
jgi:hypothetical protein